MGAMSIWHWIIVLVIIMMLFGTKKLGNIGSDLGRAIKGFKDGVKGEEDKSTSASSASSSASAPAKVEDNSTVDVNAKEKK